MIGEYLTLHNHYSASQRRDNDSRREVKGMEYLVLVLSVDLSNLHEGASKILD